MNDKGIINSRGGQIVCTAANVTLEPGKNRVTEEQFKVIRGDRFLKPYWDSRKLEAAEPPPVQPREEKLRADELGNDARGKLPKSEAKSSK